MLIGRTDWSWNSNTLVTWCKELTHLKRPWCWERLRARGEGDDRGWDSWMASPTQWTWVWVNSGSWWWTGRPGMLWFMGLQRVKRNWVTELNWTRWSGCSGGRDLGRPKVHWCLLAGVLICGQEGPLRLLSSPQQQPELLHAVLRLLYRPMVSAAFLMLASALLSQCWYF